MIGPSNPTGSGPSASERLRALDDQLRRGSISRSAYEAEKQRILQPERLTLPSRPATTHVRTHSRAGGPPALAYLLVVTAVCAPLSHFLWWQRVETRLAGTVILLPSGSYLLELSLTITVAAVSGWAALTLFKQRILTWPVISAIPILLCCTIRGFTALSIGTLNGAFGGGALAALVMTGCALASVIVVAIQWRRSHWAGLEFSSPVSVLGLIAAFMNLIVFFGNGWSGLLAQTGSRWNTGSMWFTWASMIALVSAIGTPLLAGFTRDMHLSLWLAAGGAVELIGVYGSLIWLGLDGTLIMTNVVLFLGASFGLLAAIVWIRTRELLSGGQEFSSIVGPV